MSQNSVKSALDALQLLKNSLSPEELQKVMQGVEKKGFTKEKAKKFDSMVKNLGNVPTLSSNSIKSKMARD